MTDITFPREAIDNLTNHQGQLDMDGIMVAVSRQALGELLTFTRAQPKYKRVDLGLKRESVPIDYKDGSHREWEIHNAAFNDGWNEAIDDIKSKYGDLYAEVK